MSPDRDEIVSSDNTTQAMVEMWDENLLTLQVDNRLSSNVTDGDIVVVDYQPIDPKSTAPKMVVTKILKGTLGGRVWGTYRDYHNRKKGMVPSDMAMQSQGMPPGYR